MKGRFRTGLILAALAVFMSQAPTSASSDTSGCITGACHKGMLQPRFVHGPVAIQLCELCHKRTGEHAFGLEAAGEELCYLCHERGKAENVNCIKCHDPHGSDLEFQLKPGAGKRCIK